MSEMDWKLVAEMRRRGVQEGTIEGLLLILVEAEETEAFLNWLAEQKTEPSESEMVHKAKKIFLEMDPELTKETEI